MHWLSVHSHQPPAEMTIKTKANHQGTGRIIKIKPSVNPQIIHTETAPQINRAKLITAVQNQRQATQTAQKYQNQTSIPIAAVQSNQARHLQKHKALKHLHSQPMNTSCRLSQTK